MPAKTKVYNRIIFTPAIIKTAVDVLVASLPEKKRDLRLNSLEIELSEEKWEHDSEDEFFADYIKGFDEANFRRLYSDADIIVHAYLPIYEPFSRVTVKMQNRVDVEKVFNIFEQNVDSCRLPKQTNNKSRAETDWVTENINKIETHCPNVARRLKLALIKIDSEDTEEWQNATMLIRDAWIELTQWLCKIKDIDTSDVLSDAVIERLKKLKIDKTDERLFNLARASFNLYAKHHKRDIDIDTAVACVISTIVSMKTVIREVL
jgi:hypothetical protein